MQEILVKSQGLSKTFSNRKKGAVEAVKEVSFEACSGEIFGLLGTNGAGKTTTLRMLATILKPTSGHAEIAGFDVSKQPGKARNSLGFMSGDTGLYDRLNACEMIAYFGKLYGMKSEKLQHRLKMLNDILEMDSFLKRRCGKLSTGQKQKVSIARTVIHDPKVLILDEPTAGLDVLASRNIITYIKSAKDEGKCVILSTHDMGEAERLCDRVAIIYNGTISTQGTKRELFEKFACGNLEDVFLKAVGVVD